MTEETKVLRSENQAPSSSNFKPSKPVGEASRCKYRSATDNESKKVQYVYGFLKKVGSSFL